MIITPYNLSIRNKRSGEEIFLDGRDGYAVAPLRGMSAIPVDLHLTQGVGQVGSTVQGQSVQGYSIVITGTILGYVNDRRKRMHDVILPENECELIYREDRETWILDVFPTVNPDIQHVKSFAKFGFTLFAPHPYWKSSRGTSGMLSGLIARFQFPVNYGDPEFHMFGERIKEISVIVKNTGNVAVNFTLTYFASAPILNPTLHNVVTGDFIKINRALKAGERVIIDMESTPMTVTSHYRGEVSNIFGDLDLDSTPFMLEVGENILQDGAESGYGVLDTLVSYRIAYTGVW